MFTIGIIGCLTFITIFFLQETKDLALQDEIEEIILKKA